MVVATVHSKLYCFFVVECFGFLPVHSFGFFSVWSVVVVVNRLSIHALSVLYNFGVEPDSNNMAWALWPSLRRQLAIYFSARSSLVVVVVVVIGAPSNVVQWLYQCFVVVVVWWLTQSVMCVATHPFYLHLPILSYSLSCIYLVVPYGWPSLTWVIYVLISYTSTQWWWWASFPFGLVCKCEWVSMSLYDHHRRRVIFR